jgi:hypothetical protein
MDPRFSFSNSYPVQHPVWTEAIRNSKVDHSIEPIGKALAMLYGNIPKPKQISVQSRWHHGGGKIDDYVLNDLCDFTVRVSLLSKEFTKADYTQPVAGVDLCLENPISVRKSCPLFAWRRI